MTRTNRANRAVAGVLVACGLTVSMCLGVALPANAAGYLPGVPDPLHPHHIVYYDEGGGKWDKMLDAATENDAIKQKALAASKSAQTVPSSFWKRQVDAVKAGTSRFPTVAKVLEQGNLTRYSSAAVLVQEGKLTGTTAQLAQAAASAPKIPAFGLGQLAKGAGTAGLVLGGYQVGTIIGDAGLQMFGIDPTGVVCANTGQDPTGKLVALISGKVCPDMSPGTDYVKNADGGKINSGTACNNAGTLCLTLLEHMTGNGSKFARYTVAVPGTIEGNLNQKYDTGTVSQVTATQYVAGVGSGGNGYRLGYIGASTSTKTVTCFSFADRPAAQQCGSGGGANVSITAPDPVRKFTTTITGSNGSPYTASTPDWKESDPVYPLPAVPVLPPGVSPVNMKVEETGGITATVYDKPVSADYADLVAAYPLCGEGQCLLDLRVAGASCYAGETDCAGWFADPDRDTKYTCTYGMYSVALAECYVLAEQFKQESLAAGAPLADPDTGAAVGTSASPQGGAVMGEGVAAADEPRNCFPTGWAALNPVEWVVRPVQCALEWAFVPRETVLAADAATIADSWDGTAPALAFGAMAAWNINFNVSGCDGAPFWFEYGPTTTNIGVPSACPGTPLYPFAMVMQVAGSIVLILTAALAVRKHTGAAVGFTP